MKRETYHYFLFALSLLGMLVAGYVLSTRIGQVPLVCVAGSDCAVVQASRYAYILGIPISAYGLAFYTTMFGLALAVRRNTRLLNVVFLLSVFGFLFSGYLTYVQKFLIGTFCFWCIVSAVTSTVLFVVAALLFIQERRAI